MIHKYVFRDKHIVMDVNSGAVHLVEPVLYEALDFYDGKECRKQELFDVLSARYSVLEIEDAVSDIDELISSGMLFCEDMSSPAIFDKKEPIVKAMCLHVAHDCNMNCAYCFGDKGAFEGVRCMLSLETGKKAIDFLIDNSGSRVNLEIDFFGGEPLMNFDVVKELVKYGRQREKERGKNIRFTITTNGILLDDDKIAYINENMDNVILSIDGRPEVNDRMRKTVNDKGTYDIIMRNYKNFTEKREGLYYVRGTFTRYNLDFSEDVKHLLDMGFENVSVEPVVTSQEYDYALRDEDLEIILKEYDRLSNLYIENALKGEPFDFFHFNVDLEQGPCLIKRVSGCGAGTEYVAVSPEGDIYPCHQFVGNKDFMIGNLNDEKFENKLFNTFNKAHIYNKTECFNCWAKFYCSGGCHANAWNTNGDIMKPYSLGCEMEKKRVECAVGIQAFLSEEM
ncbi:MAG: thioether cross-link-forming SCIFF peptide maturase [Firmicutes bacterium]|nr:thioether cross-link-forming SCIFF peptide maturase [Bacillota bacterium]